ncbi:polymer-forming cytoskeletal protein [Streptosporangium canum]|uniref:polymer-forming cytoskeletal protein n=1 Tax=Streptosporangium canum TaxID=324952 RepID=UPI00343FCAD8
MSGAHLLHYTTTTSPTPLQAGRPDKPAAARIDLTVSSPAGQQIYCEKIDIAVPLSEPEGGGAYFTEQPQAEVTGGNWNPLSVQVKSGQEIGLAATTNYYHVIFEPPDIPGFDLVNEPLQFRITGKLAATTGSGLTCLVTERSGTTSDTETRKDTFELTLSTAEPVFYLHSFLAGAPDKPTIPKTKFNADDKVYLAWESNGSFFQVYDGDGTTLYEGSATSCTIPGGTIVSDTTFTLRASVTTGFGTSYQCATITITITNPTLDDLKVTNKLTTVGSNGLTVNGDLTAQSSLNVSGSLTAQGDMYARANLQVDHNATVYGKANITALFEEAIKIEPVFDNIRTEYIYAEHDGILVIENTYTGNYYGSDVPYIFVYEGEGEGTAAISVSIKGSPACYTIPVRKGQKWALWNLNLDSYSSFRFYWVGFC